MRLRLRLRRSRGIGRGSRGRGLACWLGAMGARNWIRSEDSSLCASEALYLFVDEFSWGFGMSCGGRAPSHAKSRVERKTLNNSPHSFIGKCRVDGDEARECTLRLSASRTRACDARNKTTPQPRPPPGPLSS